MLDLRNIALAQTRPQLLKSGVRRRRLTTCSARV